MIKKAVTYFILLTLALYGLRYLHFKGLLSQKRGYYEKYRTAFLMKNDFDVVFLGSSRVAVAYNTGLFDTITGCNSFNLSLSGANSQVAFAALKAYLLNSKAPKYIIYETDAHYVRYNTNDIKDFNNYFPFLKNKVLLEEFNKIDPRMKHFYYDPYYSWPYTGIKNIATSLNSWLGRPTKTDKLFYKGYILDDFNNRFCLSIPLPYRAFYEEKNRAYLDSIIQICRQKNMKLTLVTSPIFAGGKIDLTNRDSIIEEIDHIALANKVKHWNLVFLPFCTSRHYFVDHFHLGNEGARIFTQKLAELYSNNYQKKPLKP